MSIQAAADGRPTARAARGDEADLFCAHHESLWWTLRRRIHGPDALIDDACGHAWEALLRSQPERTTVFAWLLVVAEREAWRLSGRGPLPLSAVAPHDAAAFAEALLPAHPAPDAQIEARERLRAVADTVAPRQRRTLALQALGFSYAEIAERDGLTHTAVNRHLSRARARLAARGI